MGFWQAVGTLDTGPAVIFFVALLVALGFEFINGFHDTANAVTTVIYTRTLSPTPAVIYSGTMNFLGALVTVLGGAGVAFGIVNLLPVDLLVNANSVAALISVLALLLTGVMWNLSTWFFGIPVSSSHTLIGSILGVGLANSLLANGNIQGVNWSKAGETFLFLFISPIIGFICAGLLLLMLKFTIREPRLYVPPQGNDRPPGWIRAVLITTCGGVSFAHGSNDGQKGMGLLLLVLIGFLPYHYALDGQDADKLAAVRDALPKLNALNLPPGNQANGPTPAEDISFLETKLAGISKFDDIPEKQRWEVRQAIFRLARAMKAAKADEKLLKAMNAPIEYVPLWVVIGTALALGVGTTVGYKRIVVTVAEKIGKTHLTYAQGAAAETVAALTIAGADFLNAPVSTTQVLSSGVAGTMAANRSGVQLGTARKIFLAWIFTLPCTTLLAGVLFAIGKWLFV
jgi:phosphate/sulfate permease